MKIAYLFLTHDNVSCNFLWEDFFKRANKDKYSIYAHPKFVDKVTDFSKDYIIPHTINTEWHDPSLVEATWLLYEEALKDESNTHFVLLSHNSAPLADFETTYNSIIEQKGCIQSHLNIDLYEPETRTIKNKKYFRFTLSG